MEPTMDKDVCNEQSSADTKAKEGQKEKKEAKQNTKKLHQELEDLKLENEKLKEQSAEAQEHMLRLAAEYENFRKRTSKEKEELSAFCICETVAKLLPAIDALEAATKLETASAEDLKKGLELTLKQFGDGLVKLGIEEIATQDGFDPELHNAIMHTEDENLPEKCVTCVYQKGYKLGDKIVRHSLVSVAN